MSVIDGKIIMHIDTSCKLYEMSDTGIAFKIVQTAQHKGLAISNRLKRELDRDLQAFYDYSRIYAICIYLLIKDSLKEFDVLIICDDEHHVYVKLYLDLLFIKDKEYQSKKVMSIGELRELTGNKKLRSHADGVANIYRRKALRCIQRKQRGVQLNIVEVNYSLITTLWNQIGEEFKYKL